MKKMVIVAALSLLAASGIFSAGCGNGSVVGCEFKTAMPHTCGIADYGSSDPTGALVAAAETKCTDDKGTVVTSCSAANALGVCSLTLGGVSVVTTYYADVGGETAAAAKADCTMAGGSFM